MNLIKNRKRDTAKAGSLIDMRFRFKQFEHETFDCVHSGQSFSYKNAKSRPAIVLGNRGSDVIVVPLKTMYDQSGKLRKSVKRSKDTDTFVEITNDDLKLNHQNGTGVDLSELQFINKNQFTFDSRVDLADPSKPLIIPKPLLNKITQKAQFLRPPSTRLTFQSVRPKDNPRFHHNDPDLKLNRLRKQKLEISDPKAKQALEQKINHLMFKSSILKQAKNEPQSERRDHQLAHQKGLSRPQFEAQHSKTSVTTAKPASTIPKRSEQTDDLSF